MRKSKVFNDLFYSMGALCIMHGILQVFIYPHYNNMLGIEEFGNIISALGMVTIFAASAGLAVNNIQLKVWNEVKQNRIFLKTITVLAIVGMLFTLSFSYKTVVSRNDLICLGLIAIVTAYRSYGDVFFRIYLNYKKYFIYYIVLTGGYILGMFLGDLLGTWKTTFLLGEIGALIYLVNTREFRAGNSLKVCADGVGVFHASALMYMSMLVYYIALNFDKMILLYMINGSAVTEFYAASLMGKTFSLLVGSVNGIILSYLVKLRQDLELKQFRRICILVLGVGIVAFIVCLLFTPCLVHILYPQVEKTVEHIYIVTNLAQILCFMGSILLTVLLYLSSAALQLKVQIVFTVLLVASSPVFIHYWGIKGYSIATLIVYAVKFVTIVFLCYISIVKKFNDKN